MASSQKTILFKMIKIFSYKEMKPCSANLENSFKCYHNTAKERFAKSGPAVGSDVCLLTSLLFLCMVDSIVQQGKNDDFCIRNEAQTREIKFTTMFFS